MMAEAQQLMDKLINFDYPVEEWVAIFIHIFV
jgi:hypothetical protein